MMWRSRPSSVRRVARGGSHGRIAGRHRTRISRHCTYELQRSGALFGNCIRFLLLACQEVEELRRYPRLGRVPSRM